MTDSTARERFEREVRIVEREPKLAEFCGMAVLIKPLPFFTLEQIGADLAAILAPVMQIAVRPVVAVDGNVGGDSGPDQMVAAFNPEMFAGMGIKSVALIQRIISEGADIAWDDARKHDWASVAMLAIQILRWNFGPELSDFFGDALKDIMESFGIRKISQATSK
jgi:hypothetical protein